MYNFWGAVHTSTPPLTKSFYNLIGYFPIYRSAGNRGMKIDRNHRLPLYSQYTRDHLSRPDAIKGLVCTGAGGYINVKNTLRTGNDSIYVFLTGIKILCTENEL